MRERTVGTRELKNRLSEYLRRVKAGETIIITERGKPVGQIVPFTEDASLRIKRLVEAGVVEWNGKTLPPYQPVAENHGEGLLPNLVSEDR